MLLKTVLAFAALTKAALAAESSLAVVGFTNVSFSGSIDGTGAAGTTYVLQGTDVIGTLSELFTMTIVEDSSELLETVDLPSASLIAFAECTISGALAACEDIAEDGTALTTTIVETIAISALDAPVSIINASGSNSSSSSKGSSNSSTHASSATAGSSTASLGSLSSLPPITPTSPPATGAVPPPGPAPTVSGSGRSFEVMGLLAMLPIAAVHLFVGAL